jgi:SAM-dependent methyltransferase
MEPFMDLSAIARKVLQLGSRIPGADKAVMALFTAKAPNEGFNRVHPFDRLHGVDTSGSMPDYMLGPGATAYIAAQPSIIRQALAQIPDRGACHFFDFGCGKGRPLLVAAEFGFAGLTGLEYSSALSRMARRNGATFRKANPGTPSIEIVTGDALAFELPAEGVVIFLYNPFRRPLMERLTANLEAMLQSRRQNLYVVYYNPVWASLLDASPMLERRFAAQLPYAPEEIGFGPNESDSVVIWQNRDNVHPPSDANAKAPVRVVKPDSRAEVDIIA